MSADHKADLESIILRLLEKNEKININQVVNACGIDNSPPKRRAIQRALKSLAEQGVITPHGKARSRVYRLAEAEFEIPLTAESRELLRYLAQPLQARPPVSYQQDFLTEYAPNQTNYLSTSQRDELLQYGKVDNGIKPAGTYAREILSRLLIDLSWNSSRLEGNTYSLLETKRLLELGESAEGKNIVETQMILNHKAAIEYLVESANENRVNLHTICSVHALLSHNLLGDPSASGRIRNHSVGISGSAYIPLENAYLLEESLKIFIEKFNAINNPFEQSIFALIHLSYLQAFSDVNKRTSRLVANFPFIKHNLKPLSFTNVKEKMYIDALIGIYEKNDISLMINLFIWAYKQSVERYSSVQLSVAQPNPMKLKYRTIIAEIIRDIVVDKVSGNAISECIKNKLAEKNIPKADANELLSVIETEILSLHEHNIARFWILPEEYEAWKKEQ